MEYTNRWQAVGLLLLAAGIIALAVALANPTPLPPLTPVLTAPTAPSWARCVPPYPLPDGWQSPCRPTQAAPHVVQIEYATPAPVPVVNCSGVCVIEVQR